VNTAGEELERCVQKVLDEIAQREIVARCVQREAEQKGLLEKTHE